MSIWDPREVELLIQNLLTQPQIVQKNNFKNMESVEDSYCINMTSLTKNELIFY